MIEPLILNRVGGFFFLKRFFIVLPRTPSRKIYRVEGFNFFLEKHVGYL